MFRKNRNVKQCPMQMRDWLIWDMLVMLAGLENLAGTDVTGDLARRRRNETEATAAHHTGSSVSSA
jgi:hypothetical protein